jgi:FeS assembly protein IscX
MGDTYGWLDVETISENLAELHPTIDPVRLRFTDLKLLVQKLPGFVEDPAHPCNERILETIQAFWIAELEDRPIDEEE